jgi:hypothetical protein
VTRKSLDKKPVELFHFPSLGAHRPLQPGDMSLIFFFFFCLFTYGGVCADPRRWSRVCCRLELASRCSGSWGPQSSGCPGIELSLSLGFCGRRGKIRSFCQNLLMLVLCLLS